MAKVIHSLIPHSLQAPFNVSISTEPLIVAHDLIMGPDSVLNWRPSSSSPLAVLVLSGTTRVDGQLTLDVSGRFSILTSPLILSPLILEPGMNGPRTLLLW